MDKTFWDKLGHHDFFILPQIPLKEKFSPAPLTMLTIRNLTLHSGPERTLKQGGEGVPKYERNVHILLIEKNRLNSFKSSQQFCSLKFHLKTCTPDAPNFSPRI